MFNTKHIKKISTVLLIVLTCAFLASCTEEPDANNLFTGDSVRRIDLHWNDERDKDWEEDIRTFAMHILASHPIFNGVDSFRDIFGENTDYAYHIYNTILHRAAQRNGILADTAAAEIQQNLRDIFIYRTNALIIDIPNRTDWEVKIGLLEIAVILGDFHTHFNQGIFHWAEMQVFPVNLAYLDGGVYLVGVPREAEHALYSELIAINGIPTDEIIARIARIAPHENEYFLRFVAFDSSWGLGRKEMLVYLDIVDDSGMANFEVKNIDDEVIEFQLQAMTADGFAAMTEAELVHHESALLMDRYLEQSFWHKYFPQYSVLYVRNSSLLDVDLTGSRVVNAGIVALTEELIELANDGIIEKLILDIRGNAAGCNRHMFPLNLWPAIYDFPLLAETVENIYVIIDGGTASLAVATAANLRYNKGNVVILGTPAGCSENFLTTTIHRYLPNSRLRFITSTGLHVVSVCDDVALRPDVFIPLTIHDVINQRDPVLEYILSR